MKYSILLFALLVITNAVFSQDQIFPVAQEMPALKDCKDIEDLQARYSCTQEKLKTLIAENLRYPDEAVETGQEGYVMVSFVVTSRGGITDLQVSEDPGYGMGDAALKAVKKTGKHWIAGMNKGETVNVRMNVPVMFTLPEETDEQPEEAPDVYKVVEEMPAFAGCGEMAGQEAQSCTFEQLTRYMLDNMRYPAEAKEAGVEGTVITTFVIDEEGNVTKPIVTQGLGKGCDEEALRLLAQMPAWTPGKQKGEPVKVEMTLPFRFRMRKE